MVVWDKESLDGLLKHITVEKEGKEIRRYSTQKFIDQGRYGEVFSCRDNEKSIDVCIKISPERVNLEDKHNDLSKRIERKFEKEFFVLSKIHHQNIIKVYGYKKIDNYPLVILEKGETNIEKRLKMKGPFNLEETISYITKICSGLSELHRKDEYHRDIKASNILIFKDGTPKIADLGDVGFKVNDASSGGWVGTMICKAPETFEDTETTKTAQAEIYSVGYLMYQMLRGKKLFIEIDGKYKENEGQKAVEELVRMKKDESYTESHLSRFNVDGAFADIIRRCLQPNPDSRYSSVLELKNDLEMIIKKKDESHTVIEDVSSKLRVIPGISSQDKKAKGVIDKIVEKKAGDYLKASELKIVIENYELLEDSSIIFEAQEMINIKISEDMELFNNKLKKYYNRYSMPLDKDEIEVILKNLDYYQRIFGYWESLGQDSSSLEARVRELKSIYRNKPTEIKSTEDGPVEAVYKVIDDNFVETLINRTEEEYMRIKDVLPRVSSSTLFKSYIDELERYIRPIRDLLDNTNIDINTKTTSENLEIKLAHLKYEYENKLKEAQKREKQKETIETKVEPSYTARKEAKQKTRFSFKKLLQKDITKRTSETEPMGIGDRIVAGAFYTGLLGLLALGTEWTIKKCAYEQKPKTEVVAPTIDEEKIFYQKAEECAKKGDYGEALGCIEKAIINNPNNRLYHWRKGECLVKLGRYEESIKSFDIALKLVKPDAVKDSAYILNSRGLALIESKKYDSAINDFCTSIRIKNTADAYIGLMGAYTMLNEPNKVLDYARLAYAYHPEDKRIKEVYKELQPYMWEQQPIPDLIRNLIHRIRRK